jgi:hypothetical protein
MYIVIFLVVLIVLGLLIFCIYNGGNKKVVVINDEKFQVKKQYGDKLEAAYLMNRLNRKTIDFIAYLKLNPYYKDMTNHLKYRYNPSNFIEGNKSYTVRKGKKISLCLRDNNGKLYDENLMMFVLLHEISHVAVNSKNHTDEFWETFKVILQEAVKFGIYQAEDYAREPVWYCGILIKHNPLF